MMKQDFEIRGLYLLWLAPVFLLLFALPAAAQENSVTLDDVYRVAHQLYCPVCPNETLDTCRTQACARWRDEIREQLEAGRTDEQIIAAFVARYGERVIGTPQDPTLRALSVYTPYLLLVLASAVAIFTLIRWRAPRRQDVGAVSSPPSADVASPDDDYRAQLERDVRD